MYRYFSYLFLILFLFINMSAAQLSGSFTVGSGGNYATLSAAVNDLSSQGVNGAVTFNILAGTYNEQVSIPVISGASASNTITFQSQSGNAADVTLTYAATVTGANYLVKFDGTGYINMNNLTFNPTGASFSRSIDLSNAAHHIALSNLVINGNTTGNGSADHSLIYAYNSRVNNVTVNECTLNNGAFALYFHAANSSNLGFGNVFTNNLINNTANQAIYIAYQESPVISQNQIVGSPNYGMYIVQSEDAIEVTGNRVTGNTYGIYLYSCQGGTGTGADRGLVANNFVSVSGTPGNSIYLYNNTNLDIYHNSANNINGNVNTSCLYLYAGSGNNIQNNILMHHAGGLAIDIYTPSAVNITDYNNLFSTGNYLGRWNNVNQYDLSDYQAASGKESHSISVYPNFTSLSDLHTLSPWLNGKGAALGRVLTDIDGEARNGSTPDIGADEFTPAAGTTTPLSGSYTIGGSSPDYLTISDAVSDLMIKGVSDSVSMEIRNGTYDINEVIYTVPGTGPGKPVVFRSESGNRDNVNLFHIASGESDNYVFYLMGTDFIRFEDLGFTSNDAVNATYSTSIKLFGGVNYFYLVSCKFSGSNSSSFNAALYHAYQSIGKNRHIIDNEFNSGSYGIYETGYNTNSLNAGSVITGNEFNNQQSYGIYALYQKDLKIRNNQINGSPSYGLYIQNTTDAFEITGNRGAASNYALFLYSCEGGTGLTTPRGLVANNFFFNVGTSGSAIYSYATTNVDIFHNSAIHNSNNSGSSGLYLNAGSNINIQNNNIIHNGNGYAVEIYSAAAVNTMDYNNVFSTGNYLARWANTEYYDLASYQAASGKDDHSVSVYPNFSSNTDLHTMSPWLNAKGTPLSRVLTDIDGDPRNASAPDIGADEFTPDANTTTPLAGTYTIGGSAPDYASISEAVTDLLIKGISDSVFMRIRSGSYNVNQVLYTVPGSSAEKPVIFQSETNNRDNVNLYHVAAGESDNYVFYFKGADFIHLRDLAFTSNDADNATYSTSLYFYGGIDHFQLLNCKLSGSNSASSNTSLFYSYQSVSRNRQINNNQFNFGYTGLYLYGVGASQSSTGSMINQNEFNNQRSYAAYILHESNLQIKQNHINNGPSYGLYLQTCNDELEVTGNLVNSQNYPLYIYNCTGGTGLGTARGLIANNFLINNGNGGSGLYLYNNSYQDIFNNSVIHQNGISSSSGLYLYAGSENRIQNNNLVHHADGYAIDIYSASAVTTCDYNNLFSNGNFLGRWANVEQYTLEDYQDASGKEAHSISVYPGYTSVSDLHTLSPWLDGKGITLSRVSTDIDGESRHATTPDIGADEFTPDPGTMTPLSGVYTIGGSSPDYASIPDAVSDLLLKGISDSVSMEIRSGSYDVSQMMYTIPGSAIDKPVIFRSESGNRDDVLLFHIAANQNDNYIFYLKGADFIRFQNLSLAGNDANNANYSTVIQLAGGVDQFHLTNCKLSGASSSSNNASLYYAFQSVGRNRFITNNQFNSGSFGIYQYGINSSQPNSGTVVMGNEFNNQRSYGTYFLYDYNLKVKNNSINDAPTYGIYIQNGNDELEVSGNRISANSYALYLYSCTGGTGLVTERGLVANNFVINMGTSGSGIYFYNNVNQDIYHNSVLHQKGNTSSSAFYIYAGNGNNIANNIFMHKGAGYAYQVASNGSINLSDYNDLYVYGDYVGYWGSSPVATLTDFQTAGSTDANSISTNPGFFSNSDLHAVSALVNGAGMPLARVIYDIDGEMRDATSPDLGADEFDSTAVVGINEDGLAGNALPKEFRVYDNYPNPFNPTTYIKYDLPSAVHVKVEVYNMLGQMVSRLVDRQQNAGAYILAFNGLNLSSGTYFYRIQAGKQSVVRKMVLNK